MNLSKLHVDRLPGSLTSRIQPQAPTALQLTDLLLFHNSSASNGTGSEDSATPLRRSARGFSGKEMHGSSKLYPLTSTEHASLCQAHAALLQRAKLISLASPVRAAGVPGRRKKALFVRAEIACGAPGRRRWWLAHGSNLTLCVWLLPLGFGR